MRSLVLSYKCKINAVLMPKLENFKSMVMTFPCHFYTFEKFDNVSA